MNSCGDIEIKFLSREQFEKMPPDQQRWLQFEFMQSIAHTCRHRKEDCDRKYVKRSHIIFVTVFLVGVLIGLGVIQVKVFMPSLIKSAVTSAMAAM